LPSLEKIQQELGSAQSIDDFFGKDGIFARLFADTLETMLEAELTEHLGYERYAAKGRNSGNSRNGKRPKQMRTSAGDTTIQIPRDRNTVKWRDADGRQEVKGALELFTYAFSI
jgi:putative transposase